MPFQPVKLDCTSASPNLRLRRLLFHAQDRILCRFGHTEFHDGLCRDLDLLSGLGIEAGASFALLFNKLSKPRKHEFALFLCFAVGNLSNCFKEESCRSFVGFGSGGDCLEELCFGLMKGGGCKLEHTIGARTGSARFVSVTSLQKLLSVKMGRGDLFGGAAEAAYSQNVPAGQGCGSRERPADPSRGAGAKPEQPFL
jgi:hypothetical protein